MAVQIRLGAFLPGGYNLIMIALLGAMQKGLITSVGTP